MTDMWLIPTEICSLYVDITKGKAYRVINADDDSYDFIDDIGDDRYAYKTQVDAGEFELVEGFCKQILRTGDVLVMRNGGRYVVMHGYGKNQEETYLSVGGNGWVNPGNYNSDLTNKLYNSKQWDVMKVMRPNAAGVNFKDMCEKTYEVVFERVEPKKMTVEEIEAILGYKIEVVDNE